MDICIKSVLVSILDLYTFMYLGQSALSQNMQAFLQLSLWNPSCHDFWEQISQKIYFETHTLACGEAFIRLKMNVFAVVQFLYHKHEQDGTWGKQTCLNAMVCIWKKKKSKDVVQVYTTVKCCEAVQNCLKHYPLKWADICFSCNTVECPCGISRVDNG